MADAQMLGPYRLERVLGTGSFATVWLARDEVLDRRVAVKILADNWSQDSEVRRRFLSEARVLLTVESQRIVRGFHLGETPAGQPYLVMAWADRGTLGDRMQQRQREARTFDVHEVIGIATEVAHALSDVHGSGHLHRDVKPTNVLIRSSSTRRNTPGLAADETVVLADFGLARGLDLSSLTLVAGSPGYVAPEQAAGLTQLDRRADLYSLGRIMLELLTGDPGGRATTMAGAAAERIDVHKFFDSPGRPGRDVPPGLVDLIARLVAIEPDDRPSTADEVVAELHRLRGQLATGSTGAAAAPRGVATASPPARPLGPPSAPPPGDAAQPGERQLTGTQLAAPPVSPPRFSRRAKSALAGAAVIAALVIGIVIAATRGDGGEAGSTTTLADQSTQPVQLADPTSATDGSASETAAGATTGAPERPPATVPAIVASDPVPRTTPDSSRPVATATIGGVGTDPVVVGTPAGTEAGATARPSDTEAPPTSDAPATTDAPGSSLPAEAGRLTLPPGTFVSPFTPAEPGRQQGVRDGSLEDFVDELLAANPRWTVDPPTNVGADTEQVELEMVGPQRTARVQLELGAPTSGRAITAFVITYDD